MSAVRAAFDEERAFLRACDDEHAVLDRIAGYRDNMAYARRVGNAQAHAFAEHLVELAEDRLAALKAAAIRAKQKVAEPKPQTVRAEPKPVRPEPIPQEPAARPQAAPARVDDSEVVRQLQAALAASQEAERRAARERDTAERRARDASAERDSVVAVQRRAPGVMSAESPPTSPRTSVAAIGRLAPPATLPSAPTGARPTSAPRPATAARHAPPSPSATTVSPHSVPAKPDGADGRAPSPAVPTVVLPTTTTAPKPSAPPAAPADPASRSLTGADLATFRRDAGLTQVAAAQRLGVTQGTISKAESNPRATLGPALQEALLRAVRRA